MSGDVAASRTREPERRWQALRQLATRHAGYFTTRQVVRTRCEERIRTALAAGEVDWVQVGLLRLANWPTGPLDEYAMWAAWFDGAAAVSHHSAAELHGLGRLRPRFIHFSASATRVPTALRLPTPPAPQAAPAHHPRGLVVLRRALRSGDVESAGAFLVTTPVRTVLDLAESGIGQTALNEVVADAVAIHRCAGSEIRCAAAELPLHTAARLRRALART